MSLPLLSDWLPCSIHPTRIGWYQVRYLIRANNDFSKPVLRYWSGRRWSEDERDKYRAVITDADQWRGSADAGPVGKPKSDPRLGQ